jgi:hypothetical protein
MAGGVEELTTAIDGLASDDVEPVAGDEIVVLLAERARLDAQISRRVRAFDTSGEWALDGARSASAWLRHRCRLTDRDAHRLVRTARHVDAMPAVAAAWYAGSISSAHVDVLARTRHSANADDSFAEFEATFVDVAEHGTPDDVAKIARQWRDALDADLDRDGADTITERQHTARKLHLSKTMDGQWVITGNGDPETGSLIERAITAAYEKLHKAGEERSPAQQRWDALTHVCRMYLDGRSGGSNRPHLLVLSDDDTLDGDAVGTAETANGLRLSPATVQRLACDAVITEAVVDPHTSEVLELGRARRTFTPPQYRALLAQYPMCVMPGCTVPAEECYMHHLDWWAHDGRTDLPNGAPVCWHDHRLLHELGWAIDRDPQTGVITWYRPDGSSAGTTEPRRPPSPIPIRNSIRQLVLARIQALTRPTFDAA